MTGQSMSFKIGPRTIDREREKRKEYPPCPCLTTYSITPSHTWKKEDVYKLRSSTFSGGNGGNGCWTNYTSTRGSQLAVQAHLGHDKWRTRRARAEKIKKSSFVSVTSLTGPGQGTSRRWNIGTLRTGCSCVTTFCLKFPFGTMCVSRILSPSFSLSLSFFSFSFYLLFVLFRFLSLSLFF